MRARDNPFRAERLHSLAYRAGGFDWTEVLGRLRAQGGRGALRGACGTGKTTLLRQLGERLADAGLTVRRQRLAPDDPVGARRQARELAAAARPGVALLIDGADRLGAWHWRWLRWRARRASILVATTHRRGRLPTLHRCATSPPLLRDLVAELEPGTPLAAGEAERLLRVHGGNLRDVFWELYDRAASCGIVGACPRSPDPRPTSSSSSRSSSSTRSPSAGSTPTTARGTES